MINSESWWSKHRAFQNLTSHALPALCMVAVFASWNFKNLLYLGLCWDLPETVEQENHGEWRMASAIATIAGVRSPLECRYLWQKQEMLFYMAFLSSRQCQSDRADQAYIWGKPVRAWGDDFLIFNGTQSLMRASWTQEAATYHGFQLVDRRVPSSHVRNSWEFCSIRLKACSASAGR